MVILSKCIASAGKIEFNSHELSSGMKGLNEDNVAKIKMQVLRQRKNSDHTSPYLDIIGKSY